MNFINDEHARSYPPKKIAGKAFQEAVRTSNGNLSEAARRLRISRNTLYRKLRQLEQR